MPVRHRQTKQLEGNTQVCTTETTIPNKRNKLHFDRWPLCG